MRREGVYEYFFRDAVVFGLKLETDVVRIMKSSSKERKGSIGKRYTVQKLPLMHDSQYRNSSSSSSFPYRLANQILLT
jgi:hypothetical protein